MPGTLEKLEWPGFLEHFKPYLRTEAGEKRLASFSPAFSFEEALERQNRLRELADFSARSGLTSLPELPLLEPLVERAARGGILHPEELQVILRHLETARSLKELSFFPDISTLEALRAELSLSLEPGGKDLSDRASPELAEVRRRYRHFFERLHRVLEETLRRYSRKGYLQEDHIFQRKGRLVLPVRSEHRHRVPGILHDVSQSGATVFIEPAEAVPISNELEIARLEEEQARRKVLERLSRLIGEFRTPLRELEEALAEVDLGLSALKLAREYRGNFPELRPSGALKILRAIHPFFLLRREEAVPNDFRLSPEKPILVISGPNFGGKTVALKTMGMCVLLAQAGLPIPAAEGSIIPVFRKILVDLGDDQTLQAHESSFSAHVRAVREILFEADPESLVLLDEPGRATDPREGAALAVAILEALEDSGAFVAATTHLPEVKRYAVVSEKAVPASMAFKEEEGCPTYRLIYGVLGSSRGLVLAREVLPQPIIKRAESLLSGEDTGEAYLEKLRSLEQELRLKEKALSAEKESLRREREALEHRRRELEEEFRREKEALRKKVEDRIRELEGRLVEMMQEYRRLGRRRVEGRWQEEVREILESLSEATDIGELTPGQKVLLRDLGREGVVLRDLGEEVEVRVGHFRLALSKKGIKVLSDVREGPRFQVSVSSEAPSADELHLRGLTVDEALSQLETFLNRALLSGKKEVRIVHGLGTGRLMRAVRAYLRGHEAVEAIRPGAPFEGGEGVTVVRLSSGTSGVHRRRGS
ncbi:endonuclease MutS2 [Thermosulfurimonas sp. F29]|uniref:endonuclease MutS2 n=1 Tax=Thermosulfurimonas sp. F29 TaxID=2867247 RepID=UPI001C833CD3|nr:Smr/MutS family protein [Thermosulfurimonas sp. F29]MBX6422843.1 Smr/MutS family protein [Thermosulfurimonas sp. F29]